MSELLRCTQQLPNSTEKDVLTYALLVLANSCNLFVVGKQDHSNT